MPSRVLNHAYTQAERDMSDFSGDDLRTELQKQKERIRLKLAQIAGPQEVEAHDKEQAEARSKRKSVALEGVCNVARVQKPQGLSKVESSLDASQQSRLVSGMTNEQLVHELLLDPNFTLQEKVCFPYSLRSKLVSL